MQTDIQFLPYLAEFFLERKMFHTKAVEKIKTHFVFSKLVIEGKIKEADRSDKKTRKNA